MTVMELTNLSVTLRRRDVIRDVSLSVGKGEFIGLIGPNVSGIGWSGPWSSGARSTWRSKWIVV